MPDGRTVTLEEAVPADWLRKHTRPGAQITDHGRGITYRATVDERGELDHLEVVVTGYVPDQPFRSIPRESIRRATVEQVREQARAGRASLVFTPTGGLVDPSQPGQVAPPELVAHLMHEQGMTRQDLARLWGRSLRTIDRWIQAAREAYPDKVPAAKRAPRTRPGRRASQTIGADRAESQNEENGR